MFPCLRRGGRRGCEKSPSARAGFFAGAILPGFFSSRGQYCGPVGGNILRASTIEPVAAGDM